MSVQAAVNQIFGDGCIILYEVNTPSGMVRGVQTRDGCKIKIEYRRNEHRMMVPCRISKG